ncbi:hypothetical protein AAHA92_04002 [Salvia divinorum]|uniref:Uncharacterized protein n=1 Tax=Salvia divinorum TaxID=28513 RepID=A0ABD1I1U4_SALDI
MKTISPMLKLPFLVKPTSSLQASGFLQFPHLFDAVYPLKKVDKNSIFNSQSPNLSELSEFPAEFFVCFEISN